MAAFETPLLPATTAMPKELLPIVDKPITQEVAEEAVHAGIDTLVFGPGRHKRAIEGHFDANLELEAALRDKDKVEATAIIHTARRGGMHLRALADPTGPRPCGRMRRTRDRRRAVRGAFGWWFHVVGRAASVTADLVAAYGASSHTQLAVTESAGAEISKFGVAVSVNAPRQVAGLVECQPWPRRRPSSLRLGATVLTPDIFDILPDLSPVMCSSQMPPTSRPLMAGPPRSAWPMRVTAADPSRAMLQPSPRWQHGGMGRVCPREPRAARGQYGVDLARFGANAGNLSYRAFAERHVHNPT
ncbi:hypothetical protein [Sinisalibacter aestuarii]|uniref:HpcH/HpaI aldolase/citrate lyase domain-containing protein n=1 Tax=Sinisalibacter aestuarii TaxID=2949426 RepID=A0ABQ5LX99_9RHOB|nr:hypothetical protein [Sinisalibacter aestuarii]GKY89238.1 hypothetical protein STA1M1_31070 [Sinisalibacter aestuarii]